MKLLLIGPYPPPHGGISVHVAEAKRQLDQAGIPCGVLNLDRRAPESPEYIRFDTRLKMLRILFRHAREGWTFHLHTNGHNDKSWMIALMCGLAGRKAPARVLTIHSGMAPAYLNRNGWRRYLCRFACRQYSRIIAVNHQIRETLIAIGASSSLLEELPAYLDAAPTNALPPPVRDLLVGAKPLLTTVLFYRPEYAFDLLVNAIAKLQRRFPFVRCLVMGSGEQRREAEDIVKQKGLERAVKLIGDVSHDVCLGLIARSDAFVRATLNDGDSISVREALALGVPTVVSNVGARPSGAILFEPGNLTDLTTKLEACLLLKDSKDRVPPTQVSGGAHRLIEIYRRAYMPGAQA